MKAVIMFRNHKPVSYLLIAIVMAMVGCQSVETLEPKKQYVKHVKEAVVIADIGGILHGIAFDNRNSMYVGKNGKEILKVSPEGKVSPFVVVKEASGHFGDRPFIYDLAFGPDRHLYAAADDRILRISPTGKIKILIKEDFKGTWGACGITLDAKGNMYVAYDNKVLRIRPNGDKSIFIDGSTVNPKLVTVVGLEFDAAFNYLYVCDGRRGETGKLIRIPMKANGSPGLPEIIFEKSGYRPEYVSLDRRGHIVTKGPENADFVLLDSNLIPTMIECKNLGYVEIETIAFGGQGFKRNAVYGTEWFKGKIYRIDF